VTGAQTQPIRISSSTVASVLMLRIASILFHRVILHRINCSSSDAAFMAWLTLRRIVDRYLDTRSMLLVPSEREAMIGAIRTAHELSHEHDWGIPCPSIEHCTCEMARCHSELALVLAEAEAGDAQTAH
jgi:hypothetical protein